MISVVHTLNFKDGYYLIKKEIRLLNVVIFKKTLSSFKEVEEAVKFLKQL